MLIHQIVTQGNTIKIYSMGNHHMINRTPDSAKFHWYYLLIIIFATSTISISCNDPGHNSAFRPQVKSTNPANNEENVVVNTPLSVTFNKDMDSTSITDNTFIVFQDTAAIPGTVSYSDSIATFIPAINLTNNSRTTAVITTGVTDKAGNPLANNYEWNFTTGANANTDPPQISTTNPSPDAGNIPVNTDITATFDKAMDPSTINNSSFVLERNNITHSGTVEYSGTSAQFLPSSNLQNGRTYTATITDEVQDLSGNNMEENYSWTFTTEEGEDIDDVAPHVDSTDPSGNAENIPTGTSVSATFSEEMDDETIHSGSFTLTKEDNDDNIEGAISYSEQTAHFEPNEELEMGTEYSAVITDAEDLAGNSLAENYEWNFTTEEDFTPPEVDETFPEDGEEEVEEDITITVTFSEEMNPDTFSDNTFIVERENRGPDDQISGTINYSDRTASFTPDEELQEERDYEVTITTDVIDLAGNSLMEEYDWEFEVEDD